MNNKTVAVIGGGPAGLMAAEVLGAAGVQVDLYDAMPSVGRKFLLAGKGGLNLTHSEPVAAFESRFGARQGEIAALLREFGADDLRGWALGLGVPTFVGTSGRVFPTDMKAAPLLRAWLRRLRHPSTGLPVQIHMRHRWTGWSDDALTFATPEGQVRVRADAVVLALGGGSWARLGSDGAWVESLRGRGVDVAPLVSANCGFDLAGGWSEHFASRFAGQPFKSVGLEVFSASGEKLFARKGEFVATAGGVEGSLVYAASALLRDMIAAHGEAKMRVDLLPAFSAAHVAAQAGHPRGSRSLSSHLKGRLGLSGIKLGVLHEVLTREEMANPAHLAAAIKSVPLRLAAARPIDEAISSAGGVRFEELDGHLMLRRHPGLFCAGEMLDWEAPTGGYLITAAMASGRVAAHGVLQWLARHGTSRSSDTGA